MATILEILAAVWWLVLGVYVWAKMRNICKRLDRIVADMEADARSMTGGPWT